MKLDDHKFLPIQKNELDPGSEIDVPAMLLLGESYEVPEIEVEWHLSWSTSEHGVKVFECLTKLAGGTFMMGNSSHPLQVVYCAGACIAAMWVNHIVHSRPMEI